MKRLSLFLCLSLLLLSIGSAALSAEKDHFTSMGEIQKQTPMSFLEKLKSGAKSAPGWKSDFGLWVLGSTSSWIKERDVYKLAERLESNVPCLSVTAGVSSYAPTHYSTEETEAAFLILGYIEKAYPPSLCSTYGTEAHLKKVQEWLKDHPDPEATAPQVGKPGKK